MQIVERQTLTGVSVHMDDTYFRECTFDNCQLIYNGGDFGWEGCTFSLDCKLKLTGAAFRMHAFMNFFGMARESAASHPPQKALKPSLPSMRRGRATRRAGTPLL
jgi:hypothetical protein